MNVLISEWIKTKRTPIRWIVFLVPVLYSLSIIWYISNRTITSDMAIFILQTFFSVWTVLVIPLGAGLISGLIAHQEELAGNFIGLLTTNLPKYRLYLGKLMTIIMMAVISTLIAVAVLFLGISFIPDIYMATFLTIFIRAALMALLGTLPLLAFHVWISFAWGIGASIAIGGAGLLISAIMATGLGDKIWYYVPWAWPVRLSILEVAYLLNKSYISFPIKNAIIYLIIFLFIMVIGGIIWFNRWEGRKAHE